MQDIRMTLDLLCLFRVLLRNPEVPRYGYGLMQEIGWSSGKMYPMLSRLTEAGWLESSMEDADPIVKKRPLRRMYRIAPDAVARMRWEIAQLSSPDNIQNSI
jgi:DNA-binding PadR family transcriptional regulator